MSAEIPNHTEEQKPAVAERHASPELRALEEAVLAVLERHDGFCMDEEADRLVLAGALAAALVDTLRGEAPTSQAS